MIRRFFQLTVIFAIWVLSVHSPVISQHLPDVFDQGTLKEQFDYLQERTNIYNNYRAVREDMFRKIQRNSLDSLQNLQMLIKGMDREQAVLKLERETANMQLNEVTKQRDMAVKERDSFNLLGVAIDKVFYNMILWAIIAALAALVIFTFSIMKSAQSAAKVKISDLNDLKTEYEEYKKSSRERFEKQSIDHFNEIKRLKGL